MNALSLVSFKIGAVKQTGTVRESYVGTEIGVCTFALSIPTPKVLMPPPLPRH